jgi:AraC-like DNA-binding protein
VAVISQELQNSIDAFNAVPALGAKGQEVSRLKELVQYLLDLSHAKSDAVLAKASLFDPYAFCLAWGEGRFGARARRLKIECAEPPATYPALYGDRDQLARILSILAQLLAEAYQTEVVWLSISAMTRGCTLTLSLPPGLSPSCGPSLEVLQHEKDIRLELARQLSMLHGGHIRFVKDGQGVSLALLLPYPTLHGAIRTMPDDSRHMLCIGSDKVVASGFSLSTEEPLQVLPYNAVFNQDISEADRLLICVDPADIDYGTSAALSFMLDQDIVQKAEAYIALHPGSGEAVLGQSSDAAGLLRSILVSNASSALLIIGNEAALHLDMARIQGLAQNAGVRLVACASPAAAEAALSRWQPALFLVFETKLESQGFGPLLQRFPRVPLIVVSRCFVMKEEWASAFSRPHTIFCNIGEVFSDVLLQLVQRSLAGQKFLPAATAAIVAKCIFFLNKTYAEHLSRWRLASLLNTSEDYLSRIFHNQMGISLWEYLTRLRIQHAIDFLRSTGASLSEIADRTGFRDEAYFCRVFKRITNVTPGSFRGSSSAEVRKVQKSD